jgi:hypothetical protein
VLTVALALVLRPAVVEGFLTGLAPQALPDTQNREENTCLYLDWWARTGFFAHLDQMCTEPHAWVFLEEKISI